MRNKIKKIKGVSEFQASSFFSLGKLLLVLQSVRVVLVVLHVGVLEGGGRGR